VSLSILRFTCEFRADPDSAGVLGLSTALALSKHEHLSITLVSKHMPGDYDIEYASPWAGANYMPVGKPGSKLRAFEKATWPELDRICRDVPEAGIHYQDCILYGRKKDKGTAVGLWLQELMQEDAWFKELLPNVGAFQHLILSLQVTLSVIILEYISLEKVSKISSSLTYAARHSDLVPLFRVPHATNHH
jgi:hypothetical protein